MRKSFAFLCALMAIMLASCDLQLPCEGTEEITVHQTTVEPSEVTTDVTVTKTVAITTEEIPVTSETEISIDYIPIPVTTEQTTHVEPPVTSAEPPKEEPTEFDYKAADLSRYIVLGKYRGIEVFVDEWEPITEEQLDIELEIYVEELLEAAALLDGVCKSGDRVNVDFYGMIDGEPFFGGEGEGHALTLGKHEYILNVDDGIVGMAVGETRTVEATFPLDYGTESYNGKTAVFEITLNYIYPPLTDELVAEHTEYSTVKELREGIRAAAKQQAKEMLYDAALAKAMANSYFIELPENEVDKTYNRTVEMDKMFALKLNTSYEEFIMQAYGITPDEAEAIFMQQAKNEVAKKLLIYAIARDMGMDISDNAIESELLVRAGCLEMEEYAEKMGASAEQVEKHKYDLIIQKVLNEIVSDANFVETLAN